MAEDMDLNDSSYEPLFVNDLDHRYRCPVCLRALREATQTSCGHRFCRSCIFQVVGDRTLFKCPVDNLPLRPHENLFPDVAIRREIRSLLVMCNEREYGCQWTGEIREFKHHAGVCDFTQVKCDYNCLSYIRRGELSAHLDTCNMRPTVCKHCRETLQFQDLMRHHLVHCKMFPVSCTLCGQGDIIRGEIQRHLNEDNGDCPRVIVRCRYARQGCSFTSMRERMPEHEMEATFLHLTYMEKEMTSVSRLMLDVNETLANLQQDVLHTTEMLKTQQLNYNGELSWKVQIADEQDIYNSNPFYTGCPGYKFHVVLELCRHVGERSTRYASFFVCLDKGRFDDELFFPFNGICEVHLISSRPSLSATKDIHCMNVQKCLVDGANSNCQRGLLRFMNTERILGNTFCRDNCIYFNIKMKNIHKTFPVTKRDKLRSI